MIYISVQYPDTREQVYEYHLKKDPKPPLEFSPDTFVTIVIDGEELEYVLRSFENLPYHKFREEMLYCGDMEKFILLNMPE